MDVQLTPGQIGLVLDQGTVFAKLIRWAAHDGTRATHAVMHLGNGILISADRDGVQLHTLPEYGGDIVWSRIGFSEDQAHRVVKWAAARVGRPYSWLDDFLVGLTYLTGRRWPEWVRRFMSRDTEYMCSQLVTEALLQGAGIRLVPDLDPCEIAPGHLEHFFRSQGWL